MVTFSSVTQHMGHMFIYVMRMLELTWHCNLLLRLVSKYYKSFGVKPKIWCVFVSNLWHELTGELASIQGLGIFRMKRLRKIHTPYTV